MSCTSGHVNFLNLFGVCFGGILQLLPKENSSEVLKNSDDFLCSEWFSDARLNFAKNLLSDRSDNPAIVFWAEDKRKTSLSHLELYKQVARLSIWLKQNGVKKGDRVAGFLPNIAGNSYIDACYCKFRS